MGYQSVNHCTVVNWVCQWGCNEREERRTTGKMLKVFTTNCQVAREGAPKAVTRDAMLGFTIALNARIECLKK